MKEISKRLKDKIKDLEAGKLGVDELEGLVDDARELYERLLIIKYKAYEKFGEPDSAKETVQSAEEEIVQEEAIPEVEETTEEDTQEVKEEVAAFDFTAEEEQPAFDFSMSEEVEETPKEDPPSETFPLDEEINNTAAVEEETEQETSEETFPEASNTKGSTDIFKDSHVEKKEAEDENSLNQKLAEEDAQSLRKKLQSTPISDLKSEISIAKKFEYITFMFDGKNEIYEEAINTLNNCADGDEAKLKLNEYSSKFNWDLENKSIIKFVELVERRYL